MVAAGKGENDLAVGNVVGSNIFNILLILGTSATITPIALEVTAVIQDRNAQWYYYSALACSGIGSNVLALQHARCVCNRRAQD